MGYQFVQPHFVSITLYPITGLYEKRNYNMSNSLTTIFAPNIAIAQDKVLDFLNQNKSQMNATLNNQKTNIVTSVATGITGGAVGGAISGNATAAIGAVGGALLGAIKGAVSLTNTRKSQQALLTDLANQPSSVTESNGDSSYKLMNCHRAITEVNHISEIDKYKI